MAADSSELEELNDKSAGIGAWVLKIHGMQWIEYQYTRQNNVQKGRKLECLLVSQTGTYCHGVIEALYSRAKGGGGVDPAAEMKTLMDKFKDGSIFRLTKVTLADEKAEFIGAPLKMY